MFNWRFKNTKQRILQSNHIIGVIHDDRYVSRVYNYIREYDPKSVMLEIDPKDTFFDENFEGSYFKEIEKLFRDNHPECKITRGDKYGFEATPMITEFFTARYQFAKEFNYSSVTDITRLINDIDSSEDPQLNEQLENLKNLHKKAKDELISLEDIRSEKREKIDSGLLESIVEFTPDVSIIGGIHGLDLKRNNPKFYLEIISHLDYHEKLMEVIEIYGRGVKIDKITTIG